MLADYPTAPLSCLSMIIIITSIILLDYVQQNLLKNLFYSFFLASTRLISFTDKNILVQRWSAFFAASILGHILGQECALGQPFFWRFWSQTPQLSLTQKCDCSPIFGSLGWITVYYDPLVGM